MVTRRLFRELIESILANPDGFPQTMSIRVEVKVQIFLSLNSEYILYMITRCLRFPLYLVTVTKIIIVLLRPRMRGNSNIE